MSQQSASPANNCEQYNANIVIDNKEIASRQYTEIRDPGRLSDVVGKAAVGTTEDVDKAVNSANRAFQAWRNIDIKDRAGKILECADVIEAAIPELKPLLIRENGGVLWEAEADFGIGAGILKFYAGVIEDYMKPEQSEDEGSWTSVEKVPKGVVAAIVPWNMPIILTMVKLAPALLTGNTIVVKPSPTAPIALTLVLKKMAAILPEGVINVVHGGADVGSALTSHPLVRKIAFTGGTKTGEMVNVNGAGTFKSVTLELGGNDAAVILDDADIEKILPGLIKGIYTRSGQICFAVKRIYVPETMQSDLYNAICDTVKDFNVGHGLDERSNFGPLNNEKQFSFVKGLIEESANDGLTVTELGSKLEPDNWSNGYYILPHVIKNAPHSASIVKLEQFGPVIPIVPYQTIEEAVGYANDSDYGLASSVWSGDPERALSVARQLEAGSTFINTHNFDSLCPTVPFGGVKNSGMGREMAVGPTLEAYTDYHSIRRLK